MQGWLKIPGAARYMGVCPRSVRPLLKQGLRHARLPTGTVLISIKAIDEYLKKLEVNNNESERIAQTIESEADRIIREIENGKSEKEINI
ncbi:hypothetical protein ACFLZQ_01610 [Thermodesulfobacteriota bacterium]